MLSAAALLTVGMAANANTTTAKTTGAYAFAGGNYNFNQLTAKESGTTTNKLDAKGFGITAGAGYNINKSFAVQGVYTSEPNSALKGSPKTKYIENAWNFALEGKASMPINKKMSLFGLAGLDYSSYKAGVDLAGFKHEVKAGDHAGLTGVAGAGISYQLNKQINLDFNTQYVFARSSKKFSTSSYWNNTVEAVYNF